MVRPQKKIIPGLHRRKKAIAARVYNNTFYCGNYHQNNPPTMIPIKEWCKQNNYTVQQARTLIRKKYLLARTFKGKLYVLDNGMINFC